MAAPLFFDARREGEGLRRQLARVARVAAWPDERLERTAPAVSGWSVGQQLMHLALACELSLKNVSSLVAGAGRLVRPCGETSEPARLVLGRGRFPRGVARAPRFVTPPARVDLALARSIAHEAADALEAVAADWSAVEAAPACVPHQLLGDLTATQWLRFARAHTAHHLLILREIDAA